MPIQMRAIMLAISWASVSLTITAGISRAALPPQAAEQRDAAEKQDSAKAESQMAQPKQDAGIQDQDPVLTSQHGFLGLGKDFLLDQKQDLDESRASPIFGCAMAGADKWNYAGLMVTDREYSKHLSRNPNTISRYKQSLKRKCIHAHR